MLTVDDTNDLIVEIQRLHSDQRLIQAARVLKKLRVGLEHTTKEQPENEDMCAIADYVNTASWAQVSHHATHRTPRSSTVQCSAAADELGAGGGAGHAGTVQIRRCVRRGRGVRQP